jgi:hypothetical protein
MLQGPEPLLAAVDNRDHIEGEMGEVPPVAGARGQRVEDEEVEGPLAEVGLGLGVMNDFRRV